MKPHEGVDMKHNDGQDIMKAWRDFAESELGKGVLDGSAHGKYLANRLEVAFIEGWEACKRFQAEHAHRNMES